jgi:hypothetical protein
LRRWEKKGFLIPERTPTGIRRYTKSQLDMVMQTPYGETPRTPLPTPAVLDDTPGSVVPIPSLPLSDEKLTPEPSLGYEEKQREAAPIADHLDPTQPHVEAQRSIDSALENLSPVTPQKVEELHEEGHFNSVLPQQGPLVLPKAEVARTIEPRSEYVPPHTVARGPIAPSTPEQKPIFPTPPFSIEKEPEHPDPFAESGKQFGLDKNPQTYPSSTKEHSFDHLFHIEDTVSSDEEYGPSDLDEYDNDAAEVSSASLSREAPRAHEETFRVFPQTQEVASGSFRASTFPIKKVLSAVIGIVLLLFVVIILYVMISKGQSTTPPLNPIIE